MITGMNDICDPSKVKFEALLQNDSLLQRFIDRNPSLENKIMCYRKQSHKRNEDEKAWRETWDPISTAACMALGIGTGIAAGAMTMGAGTIAAIATVDLACEAYFGYHSYNNYVATTDRRDKLALCNQLPDFIKGTNNNRCSAIEAMINRHDSTVSGIDISLSILGTALALGGLAVATKNLNKTNKVKLHEKLNSVSDGAYNKAINAGKSEAKAKSAAREAVQKYEKAARI